MPHQNSDPLQQTQSTNSECCPPQYVSCQWRMSQTASSSIVQETCTTNEKEEICHIARAFLAHKEELLTTLEVMLASLKQTINQSNLSHKEKDILIHITEQVSPIGLRSLLDAIELTAKRTYTLRTETYKELATSLSRTIYQQAGVAGPTGERTFNNRHDAKVAASKEVAKLKTVVTPKPLPSTASTYLVEPSLEQLESPVVPVTVNPRAMHTNLIEPRQETTSNTGSSNAKARYNQYIKQYPILGNLVKKPKEPPSEVHAWAIACGYVMTNNISAQATLSKGIDALLWPSNNEVNAVQKVHILPHPSKNGQVYILTMEKDTCGVEPSHLGFTGLHLGINYATWCSPQYPRHIVVEISGKVSRECPFTQKRRGWEDVEEYLTTENRWSPSQGKASISNNNQVPHTHRGNNHENSSPRNSSRTTSNVKHHPTTL